MQALFIGQTYIDVTFITDHMPTGDEKHVASAYAVSFGGNAVTAAFCCAKLGIVLNLEKSEAASNSEADLKALRHQLLRVRRPLEEREVRATPQRHVRELGDDHDGVAGGEREQRGEGEATHAAGEGSAGGRCAGPGAGGRQGQGADWRRRASA